MWKEGMGVGNNQGGGGGCVTSTTALGEGGGMHVKENWEHLGLLYVVLNMGHDHALGYIAHSR